MMNRSLLDVKTIKNFIPEVRLVTNFSKTIKGYLINSIRNKLGQGNFFAWVGIPETKMPKGGYPAVLLIHGGEGNAFSDWVEFWNKKGFVALALDINGHMFNRNKNLVINPNYLADGTWGSVYCNTDEESFRSSWTGVNVTNCMISYNYLSHLAIVNKNQIFATGISWGGYTVTYLAGTDDRFTAFASVYGCGYLYRDEWALNVPGLKNLTEEKRIKWASVYDPSSFLSNCKKPILFVSAMDDGAFSSVNRKLSSLLVKGEKYFCYQNSLEHGHLFHLYPSIETYFNCIRLGEKFDSNLVGCKLKNGKFIIEVNQDCDNVDFNFTKSNDIENSHDWIWECKKINLKKGENYLDIEDAIVAVNISFYDKNEIMRYSTDIIFNRNINNYH